MPHKKQSIKRVQEEARRQLSRAYSFSSPSLGLDLLCCYWTTGRVCSAIGFLQDGALPFLFGFSDRHCPRAFVVIRIRHRISFNLSSLICASFAAMNARIAARCARTSGSGH
jgi:hypothetical protein